MKSLETMKEVSKKTIVYLTMFSIIQGTFCFSIWAHPQEDIQQEGEKKPLIPRNNIPEDAEEGGEIVAEHIEKWLHDAFEKKDPPAGCKQCCPRTAAVCNGLGRGIIFFQLGFDFSANNLFSGVSLPGKDILATIYGVCATIPISILGGRLTQNLLARLFENDLESEKAIAHKTTHCRRNGWKVLTGLWMGGRIIGSIISAPVLAYLAYVKLYKWMSWGFIVPAIPAFFSRIMIDFYAVDTLGKDAIHTVIRRPTEWLAEKRKSQNRQARIYRIRQALQNSRDFIQSSTSSEAQILVGHFFAQKAGNDQFKVLARPQNWVTEPIKIERRGWVKRGVAFVAGGIGAYGASVYYPATVQSFNHIVSLCGGDINAYASLIKGLSLVSISIGVSLPFLSAQSNMHKVSNALKGLSSKISTKIRRWRGVQEEEIAPDALDEQLKKKRRAAALVSFFASFFYTGVQAELALEFLDMSQTGARLQMAAAIFSSLSTTFWSFDEFLLARLQAGDPRTILLGKIDFLLNKLSQISEVNLKELEELFSAAH